MDLVNVFWWLTQLQQSRIFAKPSPEKLLGYDCRAKIEAMGKLWASCRLRSSDIEMFRWCCWSRCALGLFRVGIEDGLLVLIRTGKKESLY